MDLKKTESPKNIRNFKIVVPRPGKSNGNDKKKKNNKN